MSFLAGRRCILMLAGSVALIASGYAGRAEPAPEPPSPTVPRPAPSPEPPVAQPPAPQQAPQGNSSVPDDRDKTLSERLDETEGVLKPPPIGDPDLVHPPPDTGAKIKVIPPPAQLDGDRGRATD